MKLIVRQGAKTQQEQEKRSRPPQTRREQIHRPMQTGVVCDGRAPTPFFFEVSTRWVNVFIFDNIGNVFSGLSGRLGNSEAFIFFENRQEQD